MAAIVVCLMEWKTLHCLYTLECGQDNVITVPKGLHNQTQLFIVLELNFL